MSTILTPAGLVAGAIGVGYSIGQGRWITLVFLAALAPGMVALLRFRRLVLAMTVVSLVLGSSVFLELKTTTFYLRFAMLGALFAATMILPASRPVRHSRGLAKAAILLVTFALVSALWSINLSVTLQRAISLLLLLLVALASARRAWTTDDEVGRDLALVTSTIGVAFMMGLAAAAAGAGWAVAAGRFRGVLENPNAVGVASALALPISLGFVSARQGWRRAWWMAVVVATGVSLLLSQSRGGALAAGLGVFVLVALSRGVRRPLVVVASCVVGVTLLTGLASGISVPGPLESVVMRFDQDSTAGGRSSAWPLALSLAHERPVTGWGFGTTEEVFGPQAKKIAVFQGELVHNSYLQVLLEMGPAGVLLLLLVLSGALTLAWPGASSDPMRAAVYGGLIAGSASAVTESTLLSVGSVFGFTFWLLLAASVHLRWLASADAAVVSPTPLAEYPSVAERGGGLAPLVDFGRGTT